MFCVSRCLCDRECSLGNKINLQDTRSSKHYLEATLFVTPTMLCEFVRLPHFLQVQSLSTHADTDVPGRCTMSILTMFCCAANNNLWAQMIQKLINPSWATTLSWCSALRKTEFDLQNSVRQSTPVLPTCHTQDTYHTHCTMW